MSTNASSVTAYILSLIGGVIVLLSGVIGLAWFGSSGPSWGGFGGFMGRMMNGYHGFMGGYGGSYGSLSILSLVGLITGAIVIVSAIMLRVRPQDHVLWGTMIIAFSVVSFVSMGGFFIGAILGIIGGSFAISYKPKTP